MKLPENMSKIVGRKYTGQKDDEGRPHGHGIMEYLTRTDKKYKYEGHFEHGRAPAMESGMKASVISVNMSHGSGRRWEIMTAPAG